VGLAAVETEPREVPAVRGVPQAAIRRLWKNAIVTAVRLWVLPLPPEEWWECPLPTGCRQRAAFGRWAGPFPTVERTVIEAAEWRLPRSLQPRRVRLLPVSVLRPAVE
jgi:hypothetical protein